MNKKEVLVNLHAQVYLEQKEKLEEYENMSQVVRKALDLYFEQEEEE